MWNAVKRQTSHDGMSRNQSACDITSQQDELWVYPLSLSCGSISSTGFSYSGKKKIYINQLLIKSSVVPLDM